MESLQPGPAVERRRRRLNWRQEVVLALLPTLIVLLVLGLVEIFSRQRLLFASLASSAFLIYLDPQHGANRLSTLIISQLLAAILGLSLYLLFGPGYVSAGSAMVVTILLMILLDVVHPPAVATSLAFAFRAGNETNLVLFSLAVGMIAVLVILERLMLWQVGLYQAPQKPH